ncbi:hypothetical protein FACS1894163_04430 [Spirochaetia bacterium]|nr:hypothetical protein FACS1894163_04430 [Spirochaetia bacterium]
MAAGGQFFVDESGDLIFFNKRGKPVNLGEKGTSRFFLIGTARIDEDLNRVAERFNQLRNDLLNNPFCKHIPSMKETKIEFHAKNDCSIVKNEVFKLLQGLNTSVQVVVRRKETILEQAIKTYKLTGTKRTINEKELYHNMITRLFRNLPDSENCTIVFSERGKTFSDNSLETALGKARNRGTSGQAAQTVIKKMPSRENIGLQIVDYFLWTVLQMYEHDNSDYFSLLKDKYKLIMDVDDLRTDELGVHYGEKNEISLDKIKMRK